MGGLRGIKGKRMGILTQIVSGAKAEFSGQGAGAARWREIFGSTNKEESKKPATSNSFGNSIVGSSAATKRLLQAMRSMAPGGWSDDRWEQTRHFVGITYLAIHRLATQWQQSEFQVFHRDLSLPDGKRPVTPDDPVQGDRQEIRPYDLVKLIQRPNKQDSFGKWMYRTCQQKYLTGTALTWLVPNMYGVPMEMYTVPTAVAIPQPAINPDFPDGFYRIQPVYPYGPFSSYPTPNSAVGAPIPAQWMMRFQFPHPFLRYEGYSPLSGVRLHLDEVEMVDRSRHAAMRREIRPSAVLNFGESEGMQALPEEEIARIHAEFEAEVMGPENAGRLYVATPGANLEPWGTSPQEMAYHDSWEQLVSFSLAAFGITKPAAGMIEESSYASLFACLKQLYTLTLKPDVDDAAADLTQYLCPYYGDDLFIEIRVPRIDDHDIKMLKIDKAITGKAITKNELRKELDLPLTYEEWGGDMVGDPSPKEQEQMQQEQQHQQQQQQMEGSTPNSEGGLDSQPPSEFPLEEEEPAEVTSSRPSPGNLSQGALGPRKSLNGQMKSLNGRKTNNFYELTRKVIRNGRH